jgi:hypothetical protein
VDEGPISRRAPRSGDAYSNTRLGLRAGGRHAALDEIAWRAGISWSAARERAAAHAAW